MNIEHDTTVYLLSGIDIDDENEIDFNDAQQQEEYFYSHRELTLINGNENDDFKYIRQNETIVVGYSIDTLDNVNFVMYKQDDKWFYASIQRKEYVNPNATRLYLKLNTFQTYMFDYELQETFIDREHQDRFEKNNSNIKPIFSTTKENIDYGEHYEIEESKQFVQNDDIKGYYLIKSREPLGQIYIAGTSGQSSLQNDTLPTTEFNGINTGVYCYVIVANYSSGYELSKNEINISSNYIATDGFMREINSSDNIISIQFMPFIPYDIMSANKSTHKITTNQFICKFNADYLGYAQYGVRIFKPSASIAMGFVDTTFDNVSLSIQNAKDIKNETKLYTNPYRYIDLIIYGKHNVFYNENFENYNLLNFQLFESFAPNNLYSVAPLNYNSKSALNINFKDVSITNSDNELTLRSDAWRNYVMNNKASLNGGLVVAGAQTLANLGIGIATGGVGLAGGAITAINFAGQIANEMLKRQDIKQQPDTVKQMGGDIALINNCGGDTGRLIFFKIKDNFKKIIFNYFYHYGYKCNDFKKPNIRSRYYFNYIKTIGANIKSNISKENLDDLKSKFNNGLTVWHYRDADTFKGIKNFDFENVEMSILEEQEQ